MNVGVDPSPKISESVLKINGNESIELRLMRSQLGLYEKEWRHFDNLR
ncbi:hypothetical protein [Microcoleus sp. LEGE 07076]|nr:hypothetical protein [Microcoleus sp. LEGE 07076]